MTRAARARPAAPAARARPQAPHLLPVPLPVPLPTSTPTPPADRPPRAAPPARPGKARSAAECERLEQLPNIGPAMAADLRRLGVAHPRELAAHDPFALYQALGRATGRRQDPCVLDTFLAATDFMRGTPARRWWAYTAERKRRCGAL